MPKPSTLELKFSQYWKLLAKSSPAYVSEYRFDPSRRWRIDFAWPDQRIAVECEGGVYSGGRHTHGKGYEDDLEKYNQLTAQGWKLLRFTTSMLDDDPGHSIDLIKHLLQ